MRVIVSSSLTNSGKVFKNFKLVPNFVPIMNEQNISVIVIHDTDEQDFAVGLHIANIHKKGGIKFIYINKEPHSTVKMVVQGVNGYIYDDEFYLDDEEELEALLEELGVVENTSLAVMSADIVKDFIHAFARGEDKIRTPAYLEQVNAAVNELSTLTIKQEHQITAMGSSAVSIFERASNIIRSLDAQQKLLQDKLATLEENSTNAPKNGFGSNVVFFPPYTYMGNAKILLIREYAPCKYLTSFMLGYKHHLFYEKNKRVKLIFVHQRGVGVANKYTDFTSITQETAGIKTLYDNDIIATNNPKKEIMRDLLSKPCDIFIIVDRLYGQQDIVQGRATKVNAVSGMTDLDRYKVKAEDTIFSVTGPDNAFFNIQTVNNYATGADQRNAIYAQLCRDAYIKLNNKLGI